LEGLVSSSEYRLVVAVVVGTEVVGEEKVPEFVTEIEGLSRVSNGPEEVRYERGRVSFLMMSEPWRGVEGKSGIVEEGKRVHRLNL